MQDEGLNRLNAEELELAKQYLLQLLEGTNSFVIPCESLHGALLAILATYAQLFSERRGKLGIMWDIATVVVGKSHESAEVAGDSGATPFLDGEQLAW